MTDFRMSALVLCAIMLLAAIAAGAGPVAAQGDEIPSIPAAYHGELTVSEGSIDGPVLVDAVADGEIQDSIITDSDGTIGGPTIGDTKLEVQEPDDGTVEFHIGGEPITIKSVNDETVESESVDFDSGDQEIVLEADPSDIEPELELSIIETNSPVQAEDTLTVTVEVENVGPVEASQELDLQDEDGSVVASTGATVPIGESETTTISWTTTEDDIGEQTVTVVAGDETASTDVEIEPPDIAEPTPGGEDGGQGGVPGAPVDDADTDIDDSEPADDGLRNTESQFIVSSEQFGISQVRFTEETTLAAITWDTSTIPEELVTVETYEQPPESAPAVPGNVLSVSEVTLPETAIDQPATIEYRAEQSALDQVSETPDGITVVRLTDDSWEPLETTVTDETSETVTVEAETPGFSYVGVTAAGPEAVIDSPASAADGDEITVSGADSTTPFGEIVRYEWTIGNQTYTGADVTTTIEEPDETTIELTVENEAGATDTTTQTLTTGDSVPGFGILAAFGALLASGLLALRRQW